MGLKMIVIMNHLTLSKGTAPSAWKMFRSTVYFWIAGIIFIAGIVGLMFSPDAFRTRDFAASRNI